MEVTHDKKPVVVLIALYLAKQPEFLHCGTAAEKHPFLVSDRIS